MSIHMLRGKLIAVSVSDHEDLLELGYSPEHLNDVCLQVARVLLRQGASIAYGGILGAGGHFTETLQDAAKYELETHPSREPNSDPESPFINYMPWPSYLDVTAQRRARERGTCTYVDVSDRENPGEPANRQILNDAESQRKGHALSRMRRWIAHDSGARIILGGKTSNFVGLMPGILEEALFHLETAKPLYVIGGFGGAADDLAEAILQSGSKPLPKSLNQANRRGKYSFDDMKKAFPTESSDQFPHDSSHQEASQSYERLRRQVERIRADLSKGLKNGLDEAQNRALMKSEDTGEIVYLIEKGLLAVLKPAFGG
jgi:hypothetical protein